MMIEQFIRQFTDENIEYTRIDRNIYLIPEDLKEIVEKQKPFSAGLFLGEQKGKDFVPSMALLDWISARARNGKKIVLNKKAAWLYICGRDVFMEGVLKGGARKNELLLMQNELDENLGYGKAEFDFGGSRKASKGQGKIVVKNILDKGNFLRKEHKGAEKDDKNKERK